jgi:predicted glycoside hydrolase/deacetylase ChbG (UPF0249 family)
MAYLTINADDFGMTEGVSRGIRQSVSEGIVTSTSAMVCNEKFKKNIVEFADGIPGAVGIHLQLTDGRPVLPAEEIPSIVNKDGFFFQKANMLPWNMDPEEILTEWKAQMDRLRQWGIDPSYMDTHHHVHMLAQVLPVYARLGKEMNVPVRSSGSDTINKRLKFMGVSCPDFTITEFFNKELTWELLAPVLKNKLAHYGKDAVIELCCHPGISSEELEQSSFYTTQREAELSFFLKEDIREKIEQLGYHLIGMDQVKELRSATTLKN